MEKIKKFETFKKDVFDIKSNIDIFITAPMAWTQLAENWTDIRDCIATGQRSLDDEFERWNHYLFYLVESDGDIDVNLKYKIEHDTISSRKIVISTKDYSQEDYEKVIKNYIQFSLEESAEEEMNRFEKNNLVMKVLKKY